MRISALEEYGLRCLLNLAKVGPEGQLSISDIAEKEGISVPYTSKLLSILRQTGLVNALRGRGGGFCIARPANEINLLEVITALGGPLIDPDHCNKYSGQLEKCIHTDNCSVHYTLMGLSRLVGEFLSKLTLEDVLNGPGLIDLTTIQSRVSLLNQALSEDEVDENSRSVADTQTPQGI
ncbi:MAG TPA: Rrf2 family transcriptional regulator [candidate division Zixibacteria bacterium]|nr:Rrf2 family transcriptional regulator [candidate division Zixibacteria bacterium]